MAHTTENGCHNETHRGRAGKQNEALQSGTGAVPPPLWAGAAPQEWGVDPSLPRARAFTGGPMAW
eukprot:7106346-Lingulodinium_polyedra.AAC.1